MSTGDDSDLVEMHFPSPKSVIRGVYSVMLALAKYSDFTRILFIWRSLKLAVHVKTKSDISLLDISKVLTGELYHVNELSAGQ